jgi:hypothetical protein
VDVSLLILRRIKMYNTVNTVDVNSTGGDVGSNKDLYAL